MAVVGSPEELFPQDLKHLAVPLPAGYRFIDTCGFGGFGILAKVENTSTGQIMVLKLPHSITILDPSRLNRFRQEVELHSRLDLPGVANVVSRSATGEMPFLGLEYYPLGNLAYWMTKTSRSLPAREILRIGFQFASTIANLQDQGIIHRDIRPENLLVFCEKPLEVHLTDFGLATRSDATGGLTRLVDSDGFLAPEVTGVLEHPACKASDVWSAGMILAYMAWGPSRYLEVLRADSKPPDASVQSRRLLECIIHCTAVHPHNRYQDARALASDLKLILEGRPPAEAARHSALQARWLFTRRAAIGCGAAALAVLGMRWFYPTVQLTLTESDNHSDLLGVSRDIIQMARSGKLDRARSLWNLHRGDLSFNPFLVAATERAVSPSRILMDWPGEELPEIYHIAFSPDGRLMAAACLDGALRVWTWPERKPLFRAKGIGCEINMVFFSPDGSAIWSIADDGAVRVHKLAHRGDQCREIKLSNLSLPSGCVHDNCLFVGDTDAGITKLDLATGSVLWSARVGSGRVESVATKADGTILAVGLVDGLVALIDASSATAKGQFRLVPDIRWIEWFGNDIVVGGPANRVSYHNGADFRQIWSWSNGGNEARSVSILKRHDANPLVVAGADPGKVVLLDPASGNIERAYHGAPEIVRHACPSPDGNQLVAVGRNGPPTVFDATRSQEIRNWNHPTGKWVDARWADNSTLLALDTNGAIWALTTSAMNLRTSLSKPSAEAMAIGFVIGGPILWKCGSDVILSTKDTNFQANFIVGLGLGGFYIDNEFCAVAIKEKIIFATALDGFSRFHHIKFAEERLEAVNIVRDGSTLAVTCEHTVIVYSLPEMVELARFPRSEFFGALCAHIPSPGTLCIGRRSGELRMLDLKTMSFRSSIQVSPHPVSAITSHEPSGLLFTASIEGRVFTHGLRSGTVGPEWKIPSYQTISKLAISQNGERLMSLSESGRQSMITLWC